MKWATFTQLDMFIRLSILLISAFQLFSNIALGQHQYFLTYSVNEGLAQSQVRDIVQSSDGYLWIATVGGISRFDGVNFHTYNKSNGLISNLTNALYPGSDGSMIASCPGGLVIFKDQRILDYSFPPVYHDVLVNDLIVQGKQFILGTNGRGIIYFDGDSISKELSLGSEGKNYIRCLAEVQGGILAGTKEGLLFIPNEGEVRILNDTISVNEIAVSGSQPWIATNGDGLFLLDNGALQQFSKREGLLNRYVRDVAIDHKGDPWLLSKNSIQVLDHATHEFREVKSFSSEQTSNMKVLYLDSEHNVWIGTDGFGILRYTGGQFELYRTEDGLSSNIIMDIDQSSDGTYVFATYGYGVITEQRGHFDVIDNEDGLPNLTVWSLLPRSDEIWLGTSDGIQIWNHQKVNAFPFNDALPFPRVSNLFEDASGRIWIATRDGVAVWDGKELSVPTALAAINPRDAKGIVEHQGSIWMTSNDGLIEYTSDGQANQFNEQTGLTEAYLTCIKTGLQNDLWLGSEEGLLRFDIGSARFERWDLSDKVSSNIINFIEIDQEHHLWLGTDNGLFQLDLEDYYGRGVIQIRSFNQYDGIISNECNQNASYTDRDGNVWFGTNGGLVKYDRRFVPLRASTVIGVHITDIQQNFESVISTLDVRTDQAQTNAFKYNESRITFRFAAVHFSNPDKVVYSYRLHGSDDEWSPSTKENYITYSSLAPGDYAFEVRAKVGDGAWVSTLSAFHFYVAPPYYQRWWFILGVLLVLSAIVWSILSQYQKQESRKRQLIEMQNKARVLGLEQQTLNAHMNRHFIFNALNSIQYYINTQDRKQANQYLTNFASLVRKNLDSAQVDSVYLKDELERLELYINLEQMRFKDRFSFALEVDETLDMEGIQVPSMILQPFVENSIMHGILPAEHFGRIHIRIQAHSAGIKVTIDDNGIGIDTSVQRKNGTSHHVSNGMKITKQRIEIIAKAFDDAYGVDGPFELKNETGEAIGTRVEIVLPANFQKFKQMYEGKYSA
jgi:ligand-binding sensor domain-containing protein